MKKVIFIVSVLGLVWGCKKKTIEDVKPNDQNSTINMYPISTEANNTQLNMRVKNDFVFVKDRIAKVTYSIDSANAGYQKIFEYYLNYDAEGKLIQMAAYGFSEKYQKEIICNYSYKNGKLFRFIRKEVVDNYYTRFNNILYNYDSQGEMKYTINKSYDIDTIAGYSRLDSVSIEKQNNGDNLILNLEPFTYNVSAKYYEKSKYLPIKSFVFKKLNKSFTFLIEGGFHEIKYSKVKDILKDFNFMPNDDYGIINPILASFDMENVESSYINSYSPTTYQTQNEIVVDTYGRVQKIIRWQSKPDGSKDKIAYTTMYNY